MSSIFEEIILRFYDGTHARFETKNGEKITERFLQEHYFKETGFIGTEEKLKEIWQKIIKTKYEKNIIGYSEREKKDCFFLTKYFPTNKYPKLNQDFVFDFKNGKNTEYYADIFSETILNLLNQNKELAETITILPIPASTKEKNEIRYKKLFELISEKTGVINGYDVITVSKNREASHLVGKFQELEDNIEIDFEKLTCPYRIIFIDDIITTGNSFLKIFDKIKQSPIIKEKLNNFPTKCSNFIIGLFLAETYTGKERAYCPYEEYRRKPDFSNPLKKYLLKGEEFVTLENFNIEQAIEWFKYYNKKYVYKHKKDIYFYDNKSLETFNMYKLINNYVLNYLYPIQQGNGYIQYRIGEFYENCFGKEDQYIRGYDIGSRIKPDYETAFIYYKKSEINGNVKAKEKLGEYYEKGLGTEQNYEKAFKCYKEAEVNGNVILKQRLGEFYDKGLGTDQNYEKAFKYYNKIGENTDSETQYRLGYFYEKGLGTIQDYEKAFLWYKKSANEDNIKAQYKLGHLYEYGLGIEQNYKEAVYWYRQSSNIEDLSSRYRLAYLYEHGLGVEQDYKEAIFWYGLIAYLDDNLEVIYKLSNLSEKIFEKNPKNNYYKRSMLHWRIESANVGFKESQYKLAIMYQKEKKYKSAIYWYIKLAEAEEVEAQYKLACLYEEIKKEKSAIYWYTQSANAGYKESQQKLAVIYEKIKNYKSSFYWYKKLAHQGDIEAKNKIEKFYKENLIEKFKVGE